MDSFFHKWAANIVIIICFTKLFATYPLFSPTQTTQSNHSKKKGLPKQP